MEDQPELTMFWGGAAGGGADGRGREEEEGEGR